MREHYNSNGGPGSLPKMFQIFHGEVASLQSYGAFIKIPGCKKQGLVHKSQMSNSRINDPAEMLAEGEKVYCKVIAMEKNGDRISLSMKVVNQATGQDLDKNNVQLSQDDKKRRQWNFRGQNRIELGAELNTTCRRCGGHGHLAMDCYVEKRNHRYDLIPDWDKYSELSSHDEQSQRKKKKQEKKTRDKKPKKTRKHRSSSAESHSSDSDRRERKRSREDSSEKKKGGYRHIKHGKGVGNIDASGDGIASWQTEKYGGRERLQETNLRGGRNEVRREKEDRVEIVSDSDSDQQESKASHSLSWEEGEIRRNKADKSYGATRERPATKLNDERWEQFKRKPERSDSDTEYGQNMEKKRRIKKDHGREENKGRFRGEVEEKRYKTSGSDVRDKKVLQRNETRGYDRVEKSFDDSSSYRKEGSRDVDSFGRDRRDNKRDDSFRDRSFDDGNSYSGKQRDGSYGGGLRDRSFEDDNSYRREHGQDNMSRRNRSRGNDQRREDSTMRNENFGFRSDEYGKERGAPRNDNSSKRDRGMDDARFHKKEDRRDDVNFRRDLSRDDASLKPGRSFDSGDYNKRTSKIGKIENTSLKQDAEQLRKLHNDKEEAIRKRSKEAKNVKRTTEDHSHESESDGSEQKQKRKERLTNARQSKKTGSSSSSSGSDSSGSSDSSSSSEDT